MMKTRAWIALGLISLFAVYAPTTGAVNHNHAAISKTIIMETERVYGLDAARRVVAWSNLVMQNKDKPTAEKLALTNNFFNLIPIKPDVEIFGYEKWATPFEMLRNNVGSRADHAIGKYVTLEALGVSIDHLQVTHVHSTTTPDFAYMVLTYRSKPSDMPLVLDDVIGEIKPANERNDLFPQDSFNDDGLWLPREQKDGSNDAQVEAVAHEEAVAHVELWNEMNGRMNKELLPIQYPDKKNILGTLK